MLGIGTLTGLSVIMYAAVTGPPIKKKNEKTKSSRIQRFGDHCPELNFLNVMETDRITSTFSPAVSLSSGWVLPDGAVSCGDTLSLTPARSVPSAPPTGKVGS